MGAASVFRVATLRGFAQHRTTRRIGILLQRVARLCRAIDGYQSTTGEPVLPQQDNIAPDETTSLFKDAANSNAEFLSGFAAGETLSEIRPRLPFFLPQGSLTLTVYSSRRNIKNGVSRCNRPSAPAPQ